MSDQIDVSKVIQNITKMLSESQLALAIAQVQNETLTAEVSNLNGIIASLTAKIEADKIPEISK